MKLITNNLSDYRSWHWAYWKLFILRPASLHYRQSSFQRLTMMPCLFILTLVKLQKWLVHFCVVALQATCKSNYQCNKILCSKLWNKSLSAMMITHPFLLWHLVPVSVISNQMKFHWPLLNLNDETQTVKGN